MYGMKYVWNELFGGSFRRTLSELWENGRPHRPVMYAAIIITLVVNGILYCLYPDYFLLLAKTTHISNAKEIAAFGQQVALVRPLIFTFTQYGLYVFLSIVSIYLHMTMMSRYFARTLREVFISWAYYLCVVFLTGFILAGSVWILTFSGKMSLFIVMLFSPVMWGQYSYIYDESGLLESFRRGYLFFFSMLPFTLLQSVSMPILLVPIILLLHKFMLPVILLCASSTSIPFSLFIPISWMIHGFYVRAYSDLTEVYDYDEE